MYERILDHRNVQCTNTIIGRPGHTAYNLYVKMVKNCYNFALLVNSGLMGYSMMDKNVIGKNPQIDG